MSQLSIITMSIYVLVLLYNKLFIHFDNDNIITNTKI